MVWFFFFFQAEDGIRDRSPSRGLGDVYKRQYQYEIGKTYEIAESPKCCKVGFHFCEKLIDCFNYYSFDPNNKVAEIEAIGEIDFDDTNSKCCTNKIVILKELKWNEVLDMCNSGKGNSGHHNSGNYNSGTVSYTHLTLPTKRIV